MYFQVSQRNRDHLTIFESSNALNSIQSESDAGSVIADFIRCWSENKAYFLGAFLKDTGEFAAQVYIGVVNPTLPEFEVGYIADVDHEGQGFVTEAVRGALNWLFNDLGASRVRLECDETNVRSIRVAERCGFTRDGLRRETKRHPDGTYTGDLLYSLLKSEYLNRISKI
jgi:RimJ/RimL family protein N-acetyltransferase